MMLASLSLIMPVMDCSSLRRPSMRMYLELSRSGMPNRSCSALPVLVALLSGMSAGVASETSVGFRSMLQVRKHRPV